MVDLAIAANFVRELTDEQFAEPRRTRRRGTAVNRAGKGAAPAPLESRERKATRMRRTLGRLAQVRG
jgi:hypothetical protein